MIDAETEHVQRQAYIRGTRLMKNQIASEESYSIIPFDHLARPVFRLVCNMAFFETVPRPSLTASIRFRS